MSAVRELTDALIGGGMHPADAAALVVRVGAELAAAVPSKAALRTRKWRAGQASQTVTGDDSVTVEKSVTERHKPSQTVTRDDAPISNSKSLKSRERQNRGSRITPEWSPSDAERAFAKQEGFSDWEIQREAQKFRDYWTACAGAKGVKLDWSATWRQWIRNGAERAGKAPTVSSADVGAATDWDKILTSYKQFGHWSRYAGPSPDSPACLCPPEMLAKYGLVGDSQQPETPLLRGMQ